MNSEQFTGKWNQLKGSVREKFGKLTDDDVAQVKGQYEQFVGRIQERYGIAKEAAVKQVDEWMASAHRETPATHRAGGGQQSGY